MSNLDSVLSELKQQRDALNNAIAALEGVSTKGTSPKRVLSASARARIAAAQRARWAKAKGQKVEKVVSIAPKKRTMSSAAIAKIRAGQKARWAKWRKQQKTA